MATKKTTKKNIPNPNELTDKEVDMITELQDRGFSVVVITPEELDGADQERVEDRLIELSWDIINDLS